MIWARWAGVMGAPTKWEIARIFVVGTGGSGFCAEASPSGLIGFFCITARILEQGVVSEGPVAISKATTEFTRIGISGCVAALGTVPVRTIEALAEITVGRGLLVY